MSLVNIYDMDNKSDNATGDDLHSKFKVGDILKWGRYDSITIEKIDTNNKRYDFNNNESKGGRGSMEIDTIDKDAILVQSSSSANEVKKVDVSPPPVSVKAIIQINENQEITVLDAIPNGKTLNTSSPYELLENRTESVFAVKITKKVKGTCTTGNDKIKCITSDNFDYELDLTTAESNTDTLLSEDFLGNVVDATGDDTATKSNAESNTVTGSATGSASSSNFKIEKITEENIKKYLDNIDTKNIASLLLTNEKVTIKILKDNINYIEMIVIISNTTTPEYYTNLFGDNNIIENCTKFIEKVKKLINEIIDNDETPEILLALLDILHIIDPENKENINKIDTMINKKLDAESASASASASASSYKKFDIKTIQYRNNMKATGYTPKIVERGASGNCFYYSVWGGLSDIEENEKEKIIDCLNQIAKDKFGKAEKFFDIADNEKFNMQIREIVSDYYLNTNDSTFYYFILDLWVNKSLEVSLGDYSHGIEAFLNAKIIESKTSSNDDFYTLDEFNKRVSLIIKTNGTFATQTEANIVKDILLHCNVVLDIFSPDSIIFKKDGTADTKLPSKVDDYHYIYVRHINGNHFQQVQTKDDSDENSFFNRKNPHADAPMWEFIQSTVGGSRKNLKRKSKKTKRKYYVYKK